MASACAHPPPSRQMASRLRGRQGDEISVRTYTPKPGDVQRQWHVIDATDVVLGRLASQTAKLLRGKHKPMYAPHIDLSLIHISEPTRLGMISYAVFCLKK